ncbi:protein SUPPRESSOR OF K(+) TRANSPORT GROWTH DEFECT 1-like isoform X2 [Silene latifolia]|uniref:protein SUPPRESSOR OF K(+) TRANSPORT GROWTH DEFECT 1-like isoform X2 n=1 Tax=Silene latifolia TaxID=37657 RepID=UPI003D76BCC9
MYSNFKEQAIEYVKQAVTEDNAGNYAKAFPLYMNALEYFKTHLKYEKNPKIRDAITQKFTEYLRRAEEIRTALDNGDAGTGSGNGPAGVDAAVQARPKGKPKDGGGDDAEKEKLRAGLDSAIVREKPNVKWNDVAGLESAKQALQEAVILPVKFPQFFTVSAISIAISLTPLPHEPSSLIPQLIFSIFLLLFIIIFTIPNSSNPNPNSPYQTPIVYSNFKEQAIKYVKQAVIEDNAGNYAKAFPLYMNALEYFRTHLKYEKNPKIRDAITQKFTEYLRRAEKIRTALDNGARKVRSGNGPAAVQARLKGKPKVGGEDDADKEKLRAGLDSAIVREKPNVKWNDVAGLESAKQALQEAVFLPVKFPQFFTGKRRPWRAFLLYGPPGTGKSYLAKAVATEADSTFFSVSSSDLVSKWMGESEKLVSNLFQMARESAPSIIFVDEIDSLCGQRGEGNESEASRRIKTELLVQMQGVGHNDEKVLVLAATNTPYALDQAIRRRFDKRIYIPLPDQKARQHMFKVHLGDTPHDLTESDFEFLGSKTEGFSGSDISVCVKDVLFEPVRKTQDAMFFIKTKDDIWMPCGPRQPGAVQTTMQELATKGLAAKIVPPPIARIDFEKVLARQRPTVSKSDLGVHERFTQEFGEEG